MRLKNRKPQKWHPVFEYPRARGILILLTVNARGLWGRDCGYSASVASETSQTIPLYKTL